MEKVFLLLPWLNIEQATSWLGEMTSGELTKADLLMLCDAGQCAVYLDCRGSKGEMAFDIGGDVPIYEPVTGRGFCKVEYPLQLTDDNRRGTHVIGMVWAKHMDNVIKDCEWRIKSSGELLVPLFKPDDIQALADKMNRVTEQPVASAAELEDLRQELEQERTARVIAEAEVERLRGEAGRSSLAFQLGSSRAEKAEAEVAALRKEIEDTYNAQQTKERDETDEAYHRSLGWRSDQNSETPASGLTFPYATKELEAMRTAALKYWADHAPDKRHPTQKEIGHELCELLRLPRQANNDPARKAIVLATAIRPDTLMDA